MGKIKRSEAQKYAKQQKRQAQMQSAAASQKEEGQKMPENRRSFLSLGCTKGRRQLFQTIKKPAPRADRFWSG